MRNLSLRLISRCNRKWAATPDAREMETSSAPAVPWVRVLGWGSAATGAVAIGFFVGMKLRARYILNHRTSYDFYSHAGDNGNGLEYGVGI